MQVFVGTLVTPNPNKPGVIECVEEAVVCVNGAGVIEYVWDAGAGVLLSATELSADTTGDAVAHDVAACKEHGTLHTITGKDFLTSGLVDLHHHAPQEEFTGTATDTELMAWLERYTFPSEMRMECTKRALEDYRRVVTSSLHNGTTTSVYFATIHAASSMVLAEQCYELGQRAYIGKVSMDRESPEGYCEETEAASAAAAQFCTAVMKRFGDLVHPIVTPRFVPTCSEPLLESLGTFRAQHPGLLATTHVSESLDQVAFVASLAEHHGGEVRDLPILDRTGLLRDSIIAHAVYLTDDELLRCKEVNAGIVHCPLSNCYLSHSTLRTKHIVLDMGLKVGLGTDVAGGYDCSMLNAVRHCVTSSLLLAQHLNNEDRIAPLPPKHAMDYKFAFWLATVGGAQVLQRDDLGAIVAGRQFDAIHVNPHNARHRFTCLPRDSPMDVFQKWVNLGDDRHIARVWVAGKQVVGPRADPIEAIEG